MAEKRTYFIKVQGKKVEVSKETYHAYYSIERHSRTLDEKDTRNGRMLYSTLDTSEMLGEEILADKSVPSVEDTVFSRLLYERLHQCLKLLPKGEQKLLYSLFFEGITESEFSKREGIPRMTIHDRKEKILKKLRKMMEE